jgi:hydrophobic/amphiphilic exporter-1 (mainly G- bacteria), HAE1 family
MVDTWNLRFRTDRMLQLGIQESEVIRYLESITRGSFVSDWAREDERIGIRLMGRQGRSTIRRRSP